MDDGITVSMPGVRDLIAELKELKEDVARRTVRRVIRQAGEFILRRLRTNAPLDTGKLRANLDVITRWKNRSGILQAKVRISTRGKAGDTRNSYYWRFVEFVRRTVSGKRLEGQEFIAKTQREVQQPVAQMFFSALEKALNKRGRKRG